MKMQKKCLVAMAIVITITIGSLGVSLAAEPNIVPNDPLVTSFMQSDVWWALKSQRDMAIDERISNVMNLGTHNSFNASAHGFERQLYFSVAIQPNQLFTIKDQLRMGVRLIELDVYDIDIDGDGIKDMVLMHRDTVGKDWMSFDYALTEIKDWLTAAGNETEIIFLDIEDGASGNLGLLNEIKSYFVDSYPANGQCDGLISTGLIFTPEDRENCFSGRWPSRNELLALGKRIIMFNHKDLSDGNYRLFVKYSMEDEYQYIWRGSDWFFSTGSWNDISQSFSDNEINDYWIGNNLPPNVYEPHLGYQQDKSRFFAVRGDGAVGDSPRAMVGWDVAYCAVNNVNFIKMDFALGQEYDIEDKSGTGFNDFDTPGGWDNDFEIYSFLDNFRGNRLSRAIWSWQIDTYRHNPNIYFLSYQELQSPTARVANRTDGRHYAVQEGFSIEPSQLILSQDWLGVATDPSNTYFRTTRGHWNTQQKENVHPFACAKIGSSGTEWRITQGEGSWDEGVQICDQEFNNQGQGTWAFAGPVNGWQNYLLLMTRWYYAYDGGRPEVALQPVWINVSDEDKDADWTVREGSPKAMPKAMPWIPLLLLDD
jgi:hypothetical protein